MSIITYSIISNITTVDIYEWSIRKVVFRNCNNYNSYLIGYAPNINKLEIVGIKHLCLIQQVICVKNTDNIYSLCGKPGLTDEAEDIWGDFKKIARIIYEIDITHKY